MFNGRSNSWRATAIVLSTLAVDMSLHRVGPKLVYEHPSPIFTDPWLFFPTIVLLLVSVYGLLVVAFLRRQRLWPGSGRAKGLRFGIAFGALWLVGSSGASLFMGSSMFQELYTGFADAVALVVLGVLAGRLLGRPSSSLSFSDPGHPGPSMAAIPVVTAVWLLFRFVLQRALLDWLPTNPAIVVWEVALAFAVGGFYCALGHRDLAQGPLAHAIRFAAWIFGGQWLLYNLAAAAFAAVDARVLVASALIDIGAFVVAIWLSERFFGHSERSRQAGFGASPARDA